MTTVRVVDGRATVVVDQRNNATVVQSRPNRTTVRTGSTPVNVRESRNQTTVQDRRPVIAVGSNIGRRGPPGETEGATLSLPAGTTIHGLRAVRIADGALYHPDVTDPAHAEQVAGIATQSAVTGDDVLVRSGGQMSEPSWDWSPGAVWCGADGVLTQTAPTGWVLKVATVIDATTILVDIDNPFFRG